MARARVTVYEQNINRLFDPGGDVNAMARKVSRETLETARHTYFVLGITMRTGDLYRSQRIEVRRTRVRGITGSVVANAPYASFVHGGTNGTPKDVWVRPMPHSYYKTWVHRPDGVGGQKAKPWLAIAGEIVANRYGAR